MANHIADKGLRSKIHTKVIQLNSKNKIKIKNNLIQTFFKQGP